MPSRKTFCQIRHRVILLAGEKFTYKVGPKNRIKSIKWDFLTPGNPIDFLPFIRVISSHLYITGPRAHLVKKIIALHPTYLAIKVIFKF